MRIDHNGIAAALVAALGIATVASCKQSSAPPPNPSNANPRDLASEGQAPAADPAADPAPAPVAAGEVRRPGRDAGSGGAGGKAGSCGSGSCG